MGTEIVIVLGLGILTSLFSYMTFALNDQSEVRDDGRVRPERFLRTICFLLTVIFVNMLLYALILVAQNTGLTYMNDTVLMIGMEAVMWSTLAGFVLYLLSLVLFSLQFIIDAVQSWFRGRRKGDYP